MSQRTRTLRLSEEEELLLKQRAHDLGLYEHGFIRAALRFALGLAVKSDVADAIRETDVTHTQVLTRR